MPESRKFVVKMLENFIFISLLFGFFSVPVYVEMLTFRFVFIVGVAIALVIVGSTFSRRRVMIGRGFIDFMPVAFVPLSFWAARGQHFGLVTIFSVVMVVVIIMSFVVLHMAKMDETLEVLPLSSAAPLRRIIGFNYRMMAGLAGLILVLGVLTFFIIVIPAFAIIAEIFPGLPDFRQTERYDGGRSLFPMGGPERPDALGMLSLRNDPSPIMRIIGVVVQTVFIVFIVFSLVFCAYMVIRAFLKWSSTRAVFYEQTAKDMDSADEKEFILPFKKRDTSQPTNEIRRRFRAAIKRHMKNGVPIEKSDTPSDMQLRIAEDIGVGEYEKARYGNLT
ncbi:MAG: hypothetical protein FWF78_05635 [Defluviitaleaceae bacterium]|nr:hypothetical protein [Defluviitaleaceae bacterium]